MVVKVGKELHKEGISKSHCLQQEIIKAVPNQPFTEAT
jgi:hypothetical protein